MKPKAQNFQVNLRGVLDLLSDHLYSGPQVYVRELLQNCVDAITARRRGDSHHQGEIRIDIIPATPTSPPTLAAYDNGMGLTLAEVHEFLATIGQSSKRGAEERGDYIGQFGIGLLSAFVVSEEIVVITRSAKSPSQTVEWRGRSDGTYETRILDVETDPGTQVYLRAKPGCHDFFDRQFVCDTARHYGSHLPYQISIFSGDGEETVNEKAPWQQTYGSEQAECEAYLKYGELVFGMQFLDAIPLASSSGGIQGVAFVLPHSTQIASRRTHRVYLKNMLLSDQADNLLPEWAFFVRCIVNSDQLRPNAAREAFHEDAALEECRYELGVCLRNYLIRLSQVDQRRLDQLVGLHNTAIKALAIEDEDFLRLFADWLPFETNLGIMKLDQYRQLYDTIHYVATPEQFRQISAVAAAQGMCIINAGYVFDMEIMDAISRVFTDRDVEQLDISELPRPATKCPIAWLAISTHMPPT
ncbi:MAG: HSP90 family protein [Pirellulaceae bacterium]